MIRQKEWRLGHRLAPMRKQAETEAFVLGHQLSPFERDEAESIVASCLHCGRVVGIEGASSETGVYGTAVKVPCEYACRCYRCTQARITA